MSVSTTTTAGRPLVFSDALAAASANSIHRRDLPTAGRPLIFTDALATASATGKRSIDIIIPGRPVPFSTAINSASAGTVHRRTEQTSSPFRTFPFSHAPGSTLTRRQLTPADQDLLSTLGGLDGGALPTCVYKKGFSDASDPELLCPYSAKLNTECMGDVTLEDVQGMSMEEMAKVGYKCMASMCAEIENGRYLKEVTQCFEKACEEDEKAISLLEKSIKVLEKGGCEQIMQLGEQAGVAPTKGASSATASGFQTATSSAAGASKTGEAETEESTEGSAKAPVQEESSAIRLGSGWKSGAFVGAVLFGSFFAMF